MTESATTILQSICTSHSDYCARDRAKIIVHFCNTQPLELLWLLHGQHYCIRISVSPFQCTLCSFCPQGITKHDIDFTSDNSDSLAFVTTRPRHCENRKHFMSRFGFRLKSKSLLTQQTPHTTVHFRRVLFYFPRHRADK